MTKSPLCPTPRGKKQSLPFTCRPTRGGGLLRLSGSAGSGSMKTTLGGNACPFTRYASMNSPCALSTTSKARADACGRSSTASAASTRGRDRKSTRLNSSHSQISYAVFCLKKKKDFLLQGDQSQDQSLESGDTI